MAIDVLCDRVHDDVGTVVERVLDIRAEEGIIDNDHNAVLMGNAGYFSDIDKAEGRIRGAFDPD